MTSLIYFQGLRLYAVSVFVFVAALVAAFLLSTESGPGRGAWAGVVLELLVPVPVLVVASGLLQGDPALALLAVQQVPLQSLLLARWGLVLLLSLSAPLAVHVLQALLEPHASLPSMAGLAPMVFLSALAIAAAGFSGSRGVGLGVAAGYWGVSIVTLPALISLCRGTVEHICAAALWSTAYGLLGPSTLGLTVNRGLLVAAGILLALAAVRIYQYPERQVRAAAREVLT